MQYGDEKKEKLNRLERKLYSRNAPSINSEDRSEFSLYSGKLEGENVKENWQDIKTGSFDELASKVSNMAREKHNFVKKIFIFSILFFIVASGIAAFVFF